MACVKGFSEHVIEQFFAFFVSVSEFEPVSRVELLCLLGLVAATPKM